MTVDATMNFFLRGRLKFVIWFILSVLLLISSSIVFLYSAEGQSLVRAILAHLFGNATIFAMIADVFCDCRFVNGLVNACSPHPQAVYDQVEVIPQDRPIFRKYVGWVYKFILWTSFPLLSCWLGSFMHSSLALASNAILIVSLLFFNISLYSLKFDHIVNSNLFTDIVAQVGARVIDINEIDDLLDGEVNDFGLIDVYVAVMLSITLQFKNGLKYFSFIMVLPTLYKIIFPILFKRGIRYAVNVELQLRRNAANVELANIAA